MTRLPCFLLGASALLASVPVQAQLDDAMWFASRQGRQLTKVSASGEVLQTVDMTANGFDQSRLCRSPTGDLWIVNFITSTLTIVDRNGGNIQNISTASIGAPTDIGFDRNGIAWVSFNGAGQVGRFAPNGVYLNSVTVPANPQGISIDINGNIWVAHRGTAPTQISKIDPTTLTAVQFRLPTGSRTLGGVILADSPGPIGNSRIWVSGDSANELHQFDDQGTHLNQFAIGAAPNAGVNSLTLDRDGNIWAVHFRSATSQGDVYRLDRNTGAVLTTINDSPEPINVCTDSFGRVWYINRITFSGPTPSEVRRADLSPGGQFEVTAPIGNGGYTSTDPNGFHRAFVVAPLADFDGDGLANYGEIASGSSPYDAQSNAIVNLTTTGRTMIGQTPVIRATGETGLSFTLAFAFGPRVALPIPGIIGDLRLDPTGLLSVTLTAALPYSVNLPLPNNPTLIGAVLRVQGLGVGASGVRLSNDAAIVVQ